MTNVILYTRVSTDEQADGMGREAQERYLRAYCSNHDYNIVGEEQPYKEDYSAKHYDLKRPELKRIYDYCKKHRGQVNKVLFLRWDRFTRNVEFAYTYKRKFYDELGVEINAIEAPIDFTRPDWALMLAMYCGAAHAEDNKISERTKDGNHEHRIRGKWTARAPRGYKNVRAGKHNCWIEIDKEKAPAIRQAFEEVAKGLETPTRIKKRLCPYIPDSSFFDMLRNPFYAGIIRVPAYKNEPEQYVEGKHEALIDKQTFEKVQAVIDGKKKSTPKLAQKRINPDLYLRRFLVCPVCGHPLTGATSTGTGGQYTYYCCTYDHKHLNKRADEVNEGFIRYVSALKPNKAVLALYNEILSDIRGDKVRESKEKADKLESELKTIQERADKVKDLFYDGQITKMEKEQSMERYNKQIADLKERIGALRMSREMKVQDKLDYSINIIGNLGEFFKSAKPEVKVLLLGSIFPEKIEFDGKNYRTNSYNKMLDVIYQETSKLRGRKNKKSPEKTGDFSQVPGAGVEPAQPRGHWCLRPTRLPIPPSGLMRAGEHWTAKIRKIIHTPSGKWENRRIKGRGSCVLCIFAVDGEDIVHRGYSAGAAPNSAPNCSRKADRHLCGGGRQCGRKVRSGTRSRRHRMDAVCGAGGA